MPSETGGGRWMSAARRGPRARLLVWSGVGALAVAAATLAPFARASAPGLVAQKCGGVVDNTWQGFRIKPFPAGDAPLGVAVDPNSTSQVAAWDAATIEVTKDYGCSWTVSTLALGTGESIVSARFAQNHLDALTTTGTGTTGITHFYFSNDGGATFAAGNGGLPPVGGAQTLASFRHTGATYVAVDPATPTGVAVPPVPVPISGAPPVSSGSTASAIFYATNDESGFTGTSPASAFSAPIKQIVVSDDSDTLIWVLDTNGNVYSSPDSGRTVMQVPGLSGIAAMTQIPNRQLAAFGGGKGYTVSRTAVEATMNAPANVVSATARPGDSAEVLLATASTLDTWQVAGGATSDLTPKTYTTGTSLVGVTSDIGATQSFLAVTANGTLLRTATPAVVTSPGGSGNANGAAGIAAASFAPGSVTLDVPSGSSTSTQLLLALPKSPTPLDIYFLVDTSQSGANAITSIHDSAQAVVNKLLSEGVDLNVGIAEVESVQTDGKSAPPVEVGYRQNASNPYPYQQPIAYRQLSRISDPQTFLNSLSSLHVNTVPGGPRQQPQAAGLWQALTGSGIMNSDGLTYDVPKGEAAGWRNDARHILVNATDAPYYNLDDHAAGDPYPQGTPPFDGTATGMEKVLADKLNEQHVQHVGIVTNLSADETERQNAAVSGQTNTFAGPNGLRCSANDSLKPGDALSCKSENALTSIVLDAVASLQDLQPITVAGTKADAVLTSVKINTGRSDSMVNAFVAHTGTVDPQTGTTTPPLTVAVNVTCPVANDATTHVETIAETFQARAVSAQVTVNCGGGPPPPPPVVPAVARPQAAQQQQPVNNPPPQPAPAPPIPAPAPAVQAQAQAQVQAQSQAQAQAAAAEEEQAQAELAFAMAGVTDEKGAGSLAMSGTPGLRSQRTQQDEAAAVSLALAVGMSAAWFARTELRRRRRDDDVTPARAYTD